MKKEELIEVIKREKSLVEFYKLKSEILKFLGDKKSSGGK